MKYKSKTKVMREVPAVWDYIIQKAEEMIFGEVEIKIQDERIMLMEFRKKEKEPDDEKMEVRSL